MTRTRVARWAPTLGQALRLAWRPALAYQVFTFLGALAFLFTLAYYESSGSKDTALFLLSMAVGQVGVILGQVIAILRARALPVFIASGCCIGAAVWMISMARPPGGEWIGVPLVFFCFAFPCGLLSLQHRWELFASFWPAVGWIGSVFVILNKEDRVTVWEKEKVAAWLPVPLVFLGCFLVLWLVFLAAKQAVRVELWQALSGAAARRIAKKASVAAVPRRNVIPLLIAAGLLFAATAILAPYLWRTGKGDREDNRPHHGEVDRNEGEPRQGPKFDGDALMREMQRLAQSAKETLPKLWPLLLLLVLYRPAKRALLLAHLKAPLVPTPPSERIDNLWEYVRIAAEDAGVVPTAADSVEQLLVRIAERGKASPSLACAAEIYVRTRYGFTVARGDAIAMREHSVKAVELIRRETSALTWLKNLWRPLT